MSATERIRVGFVGVGTRVRTHYMPIIGKLDGFLNAGFHARSTHDDVANDNACVQHNTLQDLVASSDIIFISVPATSTADVLRDVITMCQSTGTLIVIETPVTLDVLPIVAAHPATKIVVAENWPLRTWNVLAADVIRSGVIGHVNVIVNDFRGYEYHGFAMMRALASADGRDTIPRRVCGMSWSTGPVACQTGILTENWDVGCIELGDGVHLLNNFNSVHSRSKARGPRSMRIMCEHGAMWGDDMNDTGISTEHNGVVDHHIPLIVRDQLTNNLASVTLNVGHTKFEVACDPRFDDEQMSIVRLFTRLRDVVHGSDVGYTPNDAWCDIRCVDALRYSSRMGFHVVF